VMVETQGFSYLFAKMETTKPLENKVVKIFLHQV
jgi:hypothetical protein